MTSGDTIVALSSGAPPSGVAIVRISGPQTRAVLEAVAGGVPEPRRMMRRGIGNPVIDEGLVVFFPAPHSFTGEDCAELQVHGSPAVIRALLGALSSRPGVRLATAGEFTRRAFENGKLDLTEVEGLGDLIAAETEGQRQQALARLSGGLSDRVEGWRSRLIDLRAEVEARLDFADEGDVGALPPSFRQTLSSLCREIEEMAATTDRGRIVREGVRVALAGPPNAGKSSLLNALTKSYVAIVTDEPGTTRDVREVQIDLGGQLVVLLDMAGLRETESKAEAEGVRRALGEIGAAHLVLWLVAPDVLPIPLPPTSSPVLRVGTKSDLGPVAAVDLSISAVTGDGLEPLIDRLRIVAGELAGGEPILVSRARDQAALNDAWQTLDVALGQMDNLELVAEGLRQASTALERLLGRIDAEAVLDRLFSAFCIGK